MNPQTFISICSLLIALIVAINSFHRTNVNDARKGTSEMTTLIVKLENIDRGVSEIKLEMRNMQDDIQDLREKIAIVGESTKSAHHRIDEIEKIDEK